MMASTTTTASPTNRPLTIGHATNLTLELPRHYIRNASPFPAQQETALASNAGTDLPFDDDSPFLRFVGLEIGKSENGVGQVALSIQSHHCRQQDRCTAV